MYMYTVEPLLKGTHEIRTPLYLHVGHFAMSQIRFLPAGAPRAREWLVLRLLNVFRVCLFVCLFVCLCVRTYHVSNILRHTLL